MPDIQALEKWATGLLTKLPPKARRQLARQIAITLRQKQQKRIAAQQSPDGQAFIPRKAQIRKRIGKIKKRTTMFPKIRQARYLKVQSSANSAVISFTKEVQRIAQVHHFGLRDRVNRYGLTVRYPCRPLLGFADEDKTLIADLVITHLAVKK